VGSWLLVSDGFPLNLDYTLNIASDLISSRLRALSGGGPGLHVRIHRENDDGSAVFARVTFIPAVVLIGVWFLLQLVSVGAVAQTQTGGVAYLAHIGGMVFGAVTARLFENPQT
jgi:rhomboid family protein